MKLKPFTLLIFGPPGSGKTTQADYVSREFGAIHINTGAILRRIFEDPANLANPKVQKELAVSKAGELADSAWVAEMVLREVRRLSAMRESIVFSGSPRTVIEAKAEIPALEELYPSRLLVVKLLIREEMTVARNSRRRVCVSCGKMVDASEESGAPAICPHCGGRLEVRYDDQPEIIRERLRVYHERTEPIFGYFAETGVRVISIDGEPPPEVVFESLKAVMLRHLQ